MKRLFLFFPLLVTSCTICTYDRSFPKIVSYWSQDAKEQRSEDSYSKQKQLVKVSRPPTNCLYLKEDPILPVSSVTPGVIFTNLDINTLVGRSTGSVRNVPDSEKNQVFMNYFGYIPANKGNYEIDHLISLELGGCNDIGNLWPQSYITKPWNSHVKDHLEDHCAALVRKDLKQNGSEHATILLNQIQYDISHNWTNAFVKYGLKL